MLLSLPTPVSSSLFESNEKKSPLVRIKKKVLILEPDGMGSSKSQLHLPHP